MAKQNRTDLAIMFNNLDFKRGAEVGVRRGDFSEQLCIHIKSLKKLYSVDPWSLVYQDPTSQGLGKHRQERSYRQAVKKLKKYPVCEIVRKTSMDAVRDIPYSSLDFVYIDGSHMYDYVMTDLIEWTRRVKKGGIVSGDDYKHLPQGDVIRAVNNFCEAHNILRLNVMVPRADDDYPNPTWWFQT